MDGERNRSGRPRKSEGPRVPYEEVDRILVFGEVVPCEDGNGTTVEYPSYRELADRYGVSNSVIADYAKTRNVQRRRREAQARIQAKAEHKLVELRATAIAYSKDDELRIIDTYLAGFETALAEKRVRFDNPADFNTMVRLKEFVMGNADSRQEIHASLTLESLQARHRQAIRVTETSAAERGEIEGRALPAASVADAEDVPPPRHTEDAAEKPGERLFGRFGEVDEAGLLAGSAADEGQRREDVVGMALVPGEPQVPPVCGDAGDGTCAPHGVPQRPVPPACTRSWSTSSSTSTECGRGNAPSSRSSRGLSATEEEHGSDHRADHELGHEQRDATPTPPRTGDEG